MKIQGSKTKSNCSNCLGKWLRMCLDSAPASPHAVRHHPPGRLQAALKLHCSVSSFLQHQQFIPPCPLVRELHSDCVTFNFFPHPFLPPPTPFLRVTAKAVLELSIRPGWIEFRDLPASSSRVLGLKTRATNEAFNFQLLKETYISKGTDLKIKTIPPWADKKFGVPADEITIFNTVLKRNK